MSDINDCVCDKNWKIFVKNIERKLSNNYVDENGDKYVLFGLVYARDDYYYGMYSDKNGLKLLSCLCSLETHGFKPNDRKEKADI